MHQRAVLTMEQARWVARPTSCNSGTVEYHDLEAAEALVSMSFWGQGSHKPRPLTPTSDSCDSIHLQPEAADTPKDLVALSTLVRENHCHRATRHFPFMHMNGTPSGKTGGTTVALFLIGSI